MTRIDPARLTEIFRTLSSPTSQQAAQSKKPKARAASESDSSRSGAVRDMGELKSRMRQRLLRLKKESRNFEGEAPVVAIQEVLLWEFGEEIINHADFRHVTLNICEAIESSDALRAKMQQMFRDLRT